MPIKRYRYRVYSSGAPEQEVLLAKTFGCARVVYNDFLAARRAAHEAGAPYQSGNELSRELITLAKLTPERAWLTEVSAVVLQQAIRDADRAYRNFFDSVTGKRMGPKIGLPRFKTRHNHRQTASFSKAARFTIRKLNNHKALLTLPFIGELRMELSRPLPTEPSSVTLIREPDGRMYASFVVDTPAKTPLPRIDRAAGLDMGLTHLASAVYSDGTRERVENPRFLRKAEQQLAKAQRNLARKVKGSNNHSKARLKVAVRHRKVRETRLDHAHKLALMLIRENQTISIEDLGVRSLAMAGAKGARGAGLRKSVHDAGWGQFLRLLEEKGADYGRNVIRKNPAYTSRDCSCCGARGEKLSLSTRVWACSTCHTTLDRDFNAAVNILFAAGPAETINACEKALRLHLAAGGLVTRTTQAAA